MKAKMAVLALLAVLVLGLTACDDGGSGAAGGGGGGAGGGGGGHFAVIDSVENLHVGFSIKNAHNPYLIAMYATMQDVAAEMGFQLSTRNAGGDMVQQHADVESLIAVGVDVIVMDPQDPLAAIAKGDIIAAAGIPLFLINAGADPATIFETLIQSNNVGLGNAVGEWVADQFPSGTTLNIGMLSGNPGNPVGFARRNGFLQGLSERQLGRDNATNFNVVTQGWGAWSVEGGLTATEDMLVARPDINVIFAENDAKAMGAITAVENAGRTGEVIIVGVDGMRTALEEIQAGRYHATGVNSPIELVRLAMPIVVDFMLGDNRNIPALINTVPGAIHSGNLADGWDRAF